MKYHSADTDSDESIWKILMVDDDEEDFLIVKDMLRTAKGRKFDLRWVSTYDTGLKALTSELYDAVLVDYDIGARTGIDLIQAANERGVSAPLILYTGRGNYEVDVEAMQAGAALYLSKGEANPLLLERSIRYAIEIKQKENELRLSREMLETELADRKKAQAALHENEARWREFMESTEDNYFALDREWRITYANRHYGELMGLAPEEMVGRVYWEIFPRYLGTNFECSYRKAMAESVPVHFRHPGIYTNSLYDISIYPTHEGLAIFTIDRTEELYNQKQLKDERARLEAVLQALPVGVWITNNSGGITGKNQQADRIWAGEAPLLDSMEQYPQYAAWYPESGKPVPPEEYPVAQVLKSGQPVEPVELRIQRFDGTQGTILVSAAPITDRDGRLSGVVGINVDITERKQVEAAVIERNEALELERAKLAAAIEHLPVGISIGDLQGNVLSMNSACLRLHGYSSATEMSTRAETYFQAFDLCSLDGTPIPHEEWPSARALRGEFTRGCEVLLRNVQEGTQRVVMYRAVPVQNSAGQILFVIYVIEDLTERKKAEETLRASEEHFRHLADAMPQLVWTAKPDGTVDFYNNRYKEYNGIAPSAGEKWEWAPVLHPDDLEPTIEAWNRALQTGEMYQIEHRVRMSDGVFRWNLSRGVPIKDAHGNITCWFGTATDIEYQKQNEEKLRRSNQELEQFAFVASHDLQEPLRKIIQFGGVLERFVPNGPDSPAVDYLNRMQNAAERMQVMISGLLDLSRVNTRGGSFGSVDLTAVVEEVLSDLDARIQMSSAQITVETLPTVLADDMQMRQLLQNLIGNALKFHKPGVQPVVRVTGSRMMWNKVPAVEIRVEDNGIGFEEQYAGQIFEPFQRLHGRNDYEGSGLGLAICHKIVERHDGSIEVRSEPEKGSVFCVYLPVKQ